MSSFESVAMDASATAHRWQKRNFVAAADRRIPCGEFLVARSDNRGAVFCKLGIARSIEAKKLLDRRGVDELGGVLGMAGQFLEAAEKQDLHANRLWDRWRRGKDENSDSRLVRTGGDGSGDRPGEGGAYHLPTGAATKRRNRWHERRICGGMESGDGRIGRRGCRRRCRCESGRRVDCGRTLDAGPEGTAALQPNRHHTRAGGSVG